MAKLFPVNVPIKHKCPHCGQTFSDAELEHHDDRVVRAKCPREGCAYLLDLFWLGDGVSAAA